MGTRKKSTISYVGMDNNDLDDALTDPDFDMLSDTDSKVYSDTKKWGDADANLEKAIAKITELCSTMEDVPVCSSPLPLNNSVNELSIINDSAIVLEENLEVIDTDDNNSDVERVVERDVKRDVKRDVDMAKAKDFNKKSTKKVHRPCPYCGKLQSALTRHLSTVHKMEEDVINALAKPKIERHEAFELLKKDGILKYNKKELLNEHPAYMRERMGSPEEQTVICSKCKGCYSKRYKSRHQINCGKNNGQVMIPLIPMQSMIVTDMGDDFKSVLNKMIIDDVSTLAKSDPFILVVGARIYNGQKCKSEKKNEVEKRVRQSMRLLCRLYMKFKESMEHSSECSDMFNKENLKHLRYAIDSLCEQNDNMKYGLKVQVQNILKQSAKIMEAHFLVEGKDEEADMVSNFVKVFALVEDEIFNGALYKIHQRRNKTTRKPANLPSNEIVSDLKMYLTQVTTRKNFIFKIPSDVFVDVRDAACARLTVYNGRREGEPARLFIYQWNEALNGVWLREERRESYKADIETSNRITFQEGKGNKQVPVFIPPDLVNAMEFLCSSEIRRECGVNPENRYVFPSTQQSDNHVSGWHALTSCCQKCDLNGKITGTLNRHRVSSLIGALGLSESEQSLAFDHFGHSGDINKNIYQVPQAERQLASTGKYLEMIDKHSPLENKSEEYSKFAGCSDITSSRKDRKKERRDSSESDSDTFSDTERISFTKTTDKLKSAPPRKKYQRRRHRETESDSDSTDEIGKYEPKKSFRWTAEMIVNFDKAFEGYVKRTESKPMPSQKEMAQFLQNHNSDAPSTVVRTRINNERKKLCERLKQRRKDFNIEI